MSPLPVFERFHTWQGEGVHMGKRAFFIRTHGCPVKCPFCDSAGTWHPDWVPKGIARMDIETIAQEAKDSGAPIAVITGGEPTIFDLTDLVVALRYSGLMIHLETSGIMDIKGHELMDWITLSPKKWKFPLAESVLLANEFKIIVQEPEDIDLYLGMLYQLGLPAGSDRWPIWLHPEWSHRGDGLVLDAITKAVKTGCGDIRAGYQLHKLYKVDLLDDRSRTQVPLGGVLENGF